MSRRSKISVGTTVINIDYSDRSRLLKTIVDGQMGVATATSITFDGEVGQKFLRGRSDLKKFTPEEESEVLRLRKQRWTHAKIASHLERSVNGIAKVLHRNGIFGRAKKPQK